MFEICYRRRFPWGCPEHLSSGWTALQATNSRSMHGETDGNRPQHVPPTGLLSLCRCAGKAFLQVDAALRAPREPKAVVHAGGGRGLRAQNHRRLLSGCTGVIERLMTDLPAPGRARFPPRTGGGCCWHSRPDADMTDRR